MVGEADHDGKKRTKRFQLTDPFSPAPRCGTGTGEAAEGRGCPEQVRAWRDSGARALGRRRIRHCEVCRRRSRRSAPADV